MKRIRRIKIVRKTREVGLFFGKTAREGGGENPPGVCPLCRHTLLAADEKSIAGKTTPVLPDDSHDCSKTCF